MSRRARDSICAADATSPAASPASIFWVWHQNIVPHFALCPLRGNKEGTHFKPRQLGIHLSNFTTARNVVFFFFSPASRLKPWWRWLGNSLRKLWINSMFCPWPLAPPSSVAFFDGLHMFTFHFRSLFPFYRVCGVGGGEGGGAGGGGPQKTRQGYRKQQTKQGRGVLHVLLCVYAVLSKKILILATHPLKFCCLYFVLFLFLWLFWQPRVTQKTKTRADVCGLCF